MTQRNLIPPLGIIENDLFGTTEQTECEHAGTPLEVRLVSAETLPDVQAGSVVLYRKFAVGEIDIPTAFGGVIFTPGDWLYADADGVVVAAQRLHD